MKRMDFGDFAGAQVILGSALHQTRSLSAMMPQSAAVSEEMASLAETSASLMDRLKDKMNRKKLAYAAYSRRTST